MKLPLELLLIIINYIIDNGALNKLLLSLNGFNIMTKRLYNFNWRNLSVPYLLIRRHTSIIKWMLYNKTHNFNGPAIIESNGTKEWWIHGKLHRENGPAIIQYDGTKYWYINGKHHRENDLPATIHSNRVKSIRFSTKLKRETIKDKQIEFKNVKEWWKNGRKHRINAPAIIADGREEWWVDGKLHREDGPSCIYSDLFEAWCQNNKLHRVDGPAIIYPNGREEWWENGERIR